MFLRRFTQLQFGLLLYGLSIALMVRGGLGMNPWGVFHQGLSEVTGISLGPEFRTHGGPGLDVGRGRHPDTHGQGNSIRLLHTPAASHS